MKIITNKKQKELDEMAIKKLKFVARATLQTYGRFNTPEEYKTEIERAERSASEVFWADNVI